MQENYNFMMEYKLLKLYIKIYINLYLPLDESYRQDAATFNTLSINEIRIDIILKISKVTKDREQLQKMLEDL